MAFTLADLTNMERAIASGVLTVKTGDELVTYQNMADLLKAYQLMKADVLGTKKRTVAEFKTGFR